MRTPKTSTASSRDVAPTSTVILAISSGALRASALRKWGGVLAVMPEMYSPSRFRTQNLWAGTLWLTQPPKGAMRRVPLGQMAWTMKPTSSLWASSCTTGRFPVFSRRRMYTLRIRSISACPRPPA